MRLRRKRPHIALLLIVFAILLIPQHAFAAWDHFEIVLNGGGETVAKSLYQLSLFFSDSLVTKFALSFFVGGMLFGVAIEVYRGFTTGQFSLARALGIAVFGLIIYRAFVEPTSAITVRDDVYDRDFTVSGIPLFIALPAKTVNLLEQGFTTIFYTASSDPKLNYLAKAHGATFGTFQQALKNLGTMDNAYAQKSIESFFNDCVKYIANFPSSTHGPDALNTDNIENVFAESGTHPSMFTVYYTDANKTGTSMTCQQAWTHLSPIINNPNSYIGGWKKTCGTSFGDDTPAITRCKDGVNQLLGLFHPSYNSDVLAKRIVMANTRDRALRFGWGFSSELSSKLQTEGLGMMASMNSYMFDMRYMLYALCIALMSCLAFLFPTPAFPAALTATVYLWGWLLMWSVADAITFRISVDKLVDILVSIKYSGMGIEQLIYTPTQVEKSLGLAGFIRTMSMTVSSILMGFIFKKSNPAVSGMFGAMGGWIGSKGAEAGRETMTPQGMEGALKSNITPVTTMANSGISLQAMNYGTTGFELNKMAGGTATMNEGGGNAMAALTKQTNLAGFNLGKQHGEFETAQKLVPGLLPDALGRLVALGNGVTVATETGTVSGQGGTPGSPIVQHSIRANNQTDLGPNFSGKANTAKLTALETMSSHAQGQTISALHEVAQANSATFNAAKSYIDTVANSDLSSRTEASGVQTAIKEIESRQEQLAQQISKDTGINLEKTRAVVSHMAATGTLSYGTKAEVGTPRLVAFLFGAEAKAEVKSKFEAETGVKLQDNDVEQLKKAFSNSDVSSEMRSIAKSREEVISHSVQLSKQETGGASKSSGDQLQAAYSETTGAMAKFSTAFSDTKTFSEMYKNATSGSGSVDVKLDNEVFKALVQQEGSEENARKYIQKANENLRSPEARGLSALISHVANDYANKLANISRPDGHLSNFSQTPTGMPNMRPEDQQRVNTTYEQNQHEVPTVSVNNHTPQNHIPHKGSVVNADNLHRDRLFLKKDQGDKKEEVTANVEKSKVEYIGDGIRNVLDRGADAAGSNVSDKIKNHLLSGMGKNTWGLSSEKGMPPQPVTPVPAQSATPAAGALGLPVSANPISILTPGMDSTVEAIADKVAGQRVQQQAPPAPESPGTGSAPAGKGGTPTKTMK